MKKSIVCMVCMIILFVFGCGGGGGGGESASGAPAPTPTPTPIPTPTPVPAKISLAPIPAGDLTEIINFLVNKAYADAHPELETNVRQIVADINTVLGKDPDNKKRYTLDKVMTYVDAAALYTIGITPTYFTDNNFTGKKYDGVTTNYGGTTVVYWTQSLSFTPGNIPQFFLDQTGGGGIAFATTTSIGGKTFGEVFMPEIAAATILLGKDNRPADVNGLSSYDYGISTLLHELGHTHSLGIPEWYSLACSDNSGTLPDLSYRLSALFPEDPMSNARGVREYKFAPFNSWLLNHNANHQLNMALIVSAAQNYVETQVKVVDASGMPVPGALVTVYGGVERGDYNPNIGVAKNMETVLQTTITDANGMASLGSQAPVLTFVNGVLTLVADPWFVRGVKASSNGKYAGAVATLIDSEDAYFRQGLNTHVLTLQLQ